MRIFKYKLKIPGRQKIEMPSNSKLLTVQVQRREPMLWALVDDEDSKTIDREIAIFATGEALPDGRGEYLGTFQIDEGRLVFHVFEVVHSA
jgi:hypothetical protein